MKRQLLCLYAMVSVCCMGCLFLITNTANAVPAYPDAVEVTQPDGSKFKLKLYGDEFFSWNETEEGYAVIKDPSDGYWKYANPAENKAGFIIIPNAKVGTVDPVSLNLRRSILPDKSILKQHIIANCNDHYSPYKSIKMEPTATN